MKAINNITSVKLNENEKAVLTAIINNAIDASGGDFALNDEIHHYTNGKSRAQVAGYLSPLSKKGLIYVVPSGIGSLKQITLTEDFQYLIDEAIAEGKEVDGQTPEKEEKPLSNKARVYQAWLNGERNGQILHELIDRQVKESSIKSWMSSWKSDKNLPAIAKS